jgi:hypothetical protein
MASPSVPWPRCPGRSPPDLLPPSIAGYLEVAPKWAFAGAIDWPGWCRSGKTEDEALPSLVAYGARYARVVGGINPRFEPPDDASDIQIVERLVGNSGTEFGVPAVPPAADGRPLDDAELERQVDLLQAAWRAFDAAAEAARGLELRKGPRGGGRDLDRIVEHALGGEQAYLRQLGGTLPKAGDADLRAQLVTVRVAAIQMLRARAAGEEPPMGPRRTSPFWSPRYFVRYSAWHSLDHAWEVEDRAIP